MQNIDTLEHWPDFRKRFKRPPNIRTARKKVLAEVWPGRVESDGDVWIYSVRWELNMPAPDNIEAMALNLLQG